MDFCRDDTVAAIFCSPGGYGAGRLLRLIDYDVIRKNPKIFIGFSDITAIHLAFQKMTDLVTFHGPAALSAGTESMTPYRYKYLMKALADDAPIGRIALGDLQTYLVRVHGGEVTAPITGGNLTLICSTLGTPFEIETKGKILFFEELDLEPWLMDHLLVHHLNAGNSTTCRRCHRGMRKLQPAEIRSGIPQPEESRGDRVRAAAAAGRSIIYGLPLGHSRDLATIPLGVMGRLNGDTGVFEIIERVTID
jgi:muramoyltetrapeptide carboxypeptidase